MDIPHRPPLIFCNPDLLQETLINHGGDVELVSIVIPVLNEEANISLMIDAISQNLKDENFELLFIDDGSTDGTLEEIQRHAKNKNFIRYVSLSRNFGHQNALKAGFDYASGACIITMDGDMQHPPDIIPKMLQLWRSGANVVNTQRITDSRLPAAKRITTSLFYKAFDACSNVAIRPGTADFRLIDRNIAELCKQSREDDFFWRGLIPWMGFRQEFIAYTPSARACGTTKYSLKKMLHLAWTGISSFSLLPLRASFFLGGIAFTTASLLFIHALWVYFSGAALPGWSSIMAVLLLFGSIQLVNLGIIGEYVGKIYMSTKHRPKYIVCKTNVKTSQNENA